ncbi:PepSY domain-containing protein [Bacillus sp. B-jedd]|uniref:PepSY domain-containing protein n=1 Tax=Bacillus sp. B-jedd TaxID=1476857 RepID=UPI000515626A|nr:PepSY domain-containing protein [Bacillus sp. B-jedd]CEG26555.1 Peptidase propeptide and YPEB domain protein [Bacillus sp. B-jedd]
MKAKLLTAGVLFGLIAGGTFAAGAVKNDTFNDDAKEIEIEHEVQNGEVLNKNEDHDLGGKAVKDAKLTFEEALKIAREKAEGTLTEAETEIEHGRVEYKFEFEDGKTETEITIDGNSGKIIELDRDEDHDDNDNDNDND